MGLIWVCEAVIHGFQISYFLATAAWTGSKEEDLDQNIIARFKLQVRRNGTITIMMKKQQYGQLKIKQKLVFIQLILFMLNIAYLKDENKLNVIQ